MAAGEDRVMTLFFVTGRGRGRGRGDFGDGDVSLVVEAWAMGMFGRETLGACTGTTYPSLR